MNETNWIPGLVVLGLAAGGAALFILTSRWLRQGEPPAESADDLEARYQRQLVELREHTANKHLSAPEDWAREHARLEQAASATLKARTQVKHEALKAQARAEKWQAAPTFFDRNQGLVGAVLGGAVVGFFVFLYSSLQTFSSTRAEGMSITGINPGAAPPPPGAPRGPGPGGGGPDGRLEELLKAVEAAPADVERLAELSLHLLREQRFAEAAPFVVRASVIDPFHVRTRVAREVLELAQGEGTDADHQAELDRLGTLYPAQGYEGFLYAAFLDMSKNDERSAVVRFEKYLARVPPERSPPMMRRAVQEMKARLGQ